MTVEVVLFVFLYKFIEKECYLNQNIPLLATYYLST
ncbi:hypothetical protein SAMN05444143_106172 [Flavobacterium succinicans]|uniref:Uncharacterized protein n=1 Tax=Flavobacterium succinicans TaxID=29536 RepID=A0A1I4WF87_9FLAO|nr:hypothetical protein SAMN05444143_106172 [Flavobacterium succinicans]